MSFFAAKPLKYIYTGSKKIKVVTMPFAKSSYLLKNLCLLQSSESFESIDMLNSILSLR